MIPQHGTLELSRSRLQHNLGLFREKIGTTVKLCPILKADGYGHGNLQMTHLLQKENIEWISYYALDEAIEAARLSANFNCLTLAPFVVTDPAALTPDLLHTLIPRIRLTITDAHSAQNLSAALAHSKRGMGLDGELPLPLNLHIQIDTGLTRAGASPDEAEALARLVARLPHLRLEGLFTHLSHSEIPGHPTLEEQLSLFHRIAGPLKKQFPHLLLHVQNSGGIFNLPTDNLDLVRVGIALYGLQPSIAHPIAGLQPIARVTAPLLAIHERPAGTGVGYGHTFVTRRPSTLAVAPVGYAEGYPRQISNTRHAVAQLRGVDVPVVGRVSMDQIILDVTDVSKPDAPVQPGEIATVISDDPALPNALDNLAKAIGTIGYELATHLGPRLTRIIVD